MPGTLRDIDTEFLHDLRVAVRRTRSALKLAGDVLPAGLAARFGPEFKWLGDLTTPTRDLDVYLLGYQDMADGLVSAKPAELAPFHDHLVGQRGIEYRRLARGLRSARFTRLISDWRAALGGLGPAHGRPAGDATWPPRGCAGRTGGCSARARRSPRTRPAERLHDLRKRCKELRYLLEFFASLFDPQAHQRAVKDLKGLQDCLGEFQDRAGPAAGTARVRQPDDGGPGHPGHRAAGHGRAGRAARAAPARRRAANSPAGSATSPARPASAGSAC